MKYIGVVSATDRHEDYDCINADNIFKKYNDVSIVSVWKYHFISLYLKYLNDIDTDGIIMFSNNYENVKHFINRCDYMIVLPSLDRTGYCEDVIKKWKGIKGDGGLEIV